MRKLVLVFVMGLFMSAGAWAQDWNKGKVAYDIENYATALQEWMPLAEQGNGRVHFYLGLMHFRGQGVPQNPIRAHMWFNLGAANGHSGAEEARDLVAKEMTYLQLEKARDLASECVAKNYKGC